MKVPICDLCKSRRANVGVVIEIATTIMPANSKRIAIVAAEHPEATSHICNRCISIIQDLGNRPDILTFPGKPPLRAS